jgi:HD-GYP domain-containing protein (c-di-GMP phosphodiesterase class II)
VSLDRMPPRMSEPREGVRRSELMAAISLATDIGMAQPLESGLATCLVAVALADRLGLDPPERQRTYHLSLLQHIGCTAAATPVAAIMGDELVMRANAATLDFADRGQMFAFLLSHVARTNPVLSRPTALLRAVVKGSELTATAGGICEAAQMLGRRFGYEERFLADLGRVLEYWDGKGFPGAVRGEEIPVPARVVQVATLAVACHRQAGLAGTVDLVRIRGGHSLGPAEAAAFLDDPSGLLEPVVANASLWDEVIAAEPVPDPDATDDDIDRALRAVADFVDLKAPCLANHSAGVAALAADAATLLGMPADEVTDVRRAGWLHDIGRVGVSSAIWNHGDPLTPHQWEQVRLHPYYTNRVLDRTPFLRRLGAIASAHHERVDGTGYFRAVRSAQLPLTARVLAAADAYHAMTEPRPYREAFPPDRAAGYLRNEVAAGHLDGTAADAVLQAAGHTTSARGRPAAPAGLTPREIEILRHVARGLAIKQIARELSIAPKTVDGHIQRVYAKIGVSSRAAATLFAIEHDLLLIGGASGENSP